MTNVPPVFFPPNPTISSAYSRTEEAVHRLYERLANLSQEHEIRWDDVFMFIKPDSSQTGKASWQAFAYAMNNVRKGDGSARPVSEILAGTDPIREILDSQADGPIAMPEGFGDIADLGFKAHRRIAIVLNQSGETHEGIEANSGLSYKLFQDEAWQIFQELGALILLPTIQNERDQALEDLNAALSRISNAQSALSS